MPKEERSGVAKAAILVCEQKLKNYFPEHIADVAYQYNAPELDRKLQGGQTSIVTANSNNCKIKYRFHVTL